MTQERVVVAVDDGDAAGREDGLHGRGLRCGEAHGHEAQPVAAGIGSAHLQGLQDSCGDSENVDHGMRWNILAAERGCGGDQGYGVEVGVGHTVEVCGESLMRQEVRDGETLGDEYAIETLKAEGSLAAKEVGDVGLSKASLTRKHDAG